MWGAGGGGVRVGRLVPGRSGRGEDARVALLVTRVFLLRRGVALAWATGWAVLSRWLLPGASTVVVLLGACAGVCAIAGITCFDLFYDELTGPR